MVLKELIFYSFYFGWVVVVLKELILQFLFWEDVVVLKELISYSFYFGGVWWS